MNKWILGARPRTLPAAIAPVVVATALAAPDFNWFRAALALKVAVWLQIGVNFANDYSDGVNGTDADRVGPTRLVASGMATASAVKTAAFVSFGVASIAGVWLSLLTSPWLILIGAANAVATTTGAIAAGRVRGRAPRIHLFMSYSLRQSLAINFSNTEQW